MAEQDSDAVGEERPAAAGQERLAADDRSCEEMGCGDLADPLVYVLRCSHCETELTRRGMRVWLCADSTTRLFSTDIPTEALVEEACAKSAPLCHCRIRDVSCSSCRGRAGSFRAGECAPAPLTPAVPALLGTVGYHVIAACFACDDGGEGDGNNGHYWLLHGEGVAAAPRERRGRRVLWSELPYNGVEEGSGEEGEEGGEEGGEDGGRRSAATLCSICASPMRQRTRTPCGHKFCYRLWADLVQFNEVSKVSDPLGS